MTNPLLYTAVGDSLTFGTGAPINRGFSYLVQGNIGGKSDAGLQLRNYGVVGATTSDILERFRSDIGLRQSVEEAHLITLTAGGNDLIQAAMRMYIRGETRSMKPSMRVFSLNYRALIAEMVSANRKGNGNGLFIVMDCYNPFPKVRDAVFWIHFVNRCIYRTAAAFQDNVVVARTYDAFLGKESALFSADGVHPNDDGHALMAEAVMNAIRDRFPSA